MAMPTASRNPRLVQSGPSINSDCINDLKAHCHGGDVAWDPLQPGGPLSPEHSVHRCAGLEPLFCLPSPHSPDGRLLVSHPPCPPSSPHPGRTYSWVRRRIYPSGKLSWQFLPRGDFPFAHALALWSGGSVSPRANVIIYSTTFTGHLLWALRWGLGGRQTQNSQSGGEAKIKQILSRSTT